MDPSNYCAPVTNFLSPILSKFCIGYGGYRRYLRMSNLCSSHSSPSCSGSPEDPEHVLFHCPQFIDEKKVPGRDIEFDSVTPENSVAERVIHRVKKVLTQL